MEDEKILEIIKGLNREKEVITNRLSVLIGGNQNISLRSSMERRLKDIDELLLKLISSEGR